MTQKLGSPLIATLVSLTVLGGCGEPRISATDEHGFWASVDEVREALAPERRDRFDSALSTVSLDRLDVSVLLGGRFMGSAMEALNGLTGEQVISKADSISVAAGTDDLDRLEREANALRARKESAEMASESLKRFVVVGSQFVVRTSRSERRPSIEITVTNGLGEPISRAFFRARLIDPGKRQSIVEEEFDYQIPGEIGPGETVTWTLSPDRFGPWGEAVYTAPPNAELRVTVRRLHGGDRRPLFEGVTWDVADQQRLDAITKSLSEEG